MVVLAKMLLLALSVRALERAHGQRETTEAETDRSR